METNPQIELAYRFVTQTNKHIFLTGKAGTGKTTFLHSLQTKVSKRIAVAAPTGVAAINAKGVTLHSLFQLPFGPIVPGQNNANKNRRFTKKKIKLIKSIDLLVIDEISMVRADVLDAIDGVLRRYRIRSVPFGGVQLLMIGDLHQLPPVVKPQDWALLSPHYKTAYFFGSQALQQTDYVTIELKHIYRQKDSTFVSLLNKVRNNQMDTPILQQLNSRYQANFEAQPNEGYITLTSHNNTAKTINDQRLQKIATASTFFEAEVSGNFPEHAYPTETKLEFKVGAQVMFVKNDPNPEKLFFNGKIGQVTRIETDEIYVRCPDDDFDIRVSPLEWKNIKYSLDEKTKELLEDLQGTFVQMPLKLAWAITIHKSQGLTFEKVIIDAQSAFAHGQVYVALSRCKSFEGIVLRSQIIPSSVKTDSVVRQYSEKVEANQPTKSHLAKAQKEYQQSLLRQLFNFNSVKYNFDNLFKAISDNERSIQGSILLDLRQIKETTKEKVIDVAEKFRPQLEAYLAQALMPEENEALQSRLKSASGYFTQQLDSVVLKGIKELTYLSDNTAAKKTINEKKEDLEKAVYLKWAAFKSCLEGFDNQRLAQAKANGEIDFSNSESRRSKEKKSDVKRVGLPKDVAHPKLYERLNDWRAERAEEDEVPRYTVMHTRTLLEIVHVLPTSERSLKEVHGMGKKRIEKYGEELIEIIVSYSQENGLATDQIQFTAAPQTKTKIQGTKKVSFDLYQSGKTVEQIAEERNLSTNTIEVHLAHYVAQGDLDLYTFVKREKVEVIQKYFESTDQSSLSEVKNVLGNDYSYTDLKMVMGWMKAQKKEVEKED